MSQELKRLQEVVVPILKNAGVNRSSFFGSVARGEERKNSDVDILIEFQGKKTLFDLVELKQALEKALERKVDLVTRRSIHPPLKEIIEKDEVSIF
ncbi:MAG: nucleotidyltransferase family protein [Patescibacteria group bacterium]